MRTAPLIKVLVWTLSAALILSGGNIAFAAAPNPNLKPLAPKTQAKVPPAKPKVVVKKPAPKKVIPAKPGPKTVVKPKPVPVKPKTIVQKKPLPKPVVKTPSKPVPKPIAKPVVKPKPIAKPVVKPAPLAKKPVPVKPIPIISKPATGMVYIPQPAPPPLPLPGFNQFPVIKTGPYLRPMDPDQIEALAQYLSIAPAKPPKTEISLPVFITSTSVDISFAPSLLNEIVLGTDTPSVESIPTEKPQTEILQVKKEIFFKPSNATENLDLGPLDLVKTQVVENTPGATDLPTKPDELALATPGKATAAPAPLSDGKPILTLTQVLRGVMSNNNELKEKQAKLEEIDAQGLGLKSRFSPHFDLVAQWDRNKNDWLSSNQPPLNLSTLGSSGVSFGSGGLGGGVDLGSLAGLDLGALDLANLDVNNLDLGNLDLGGIDLGGIDLNSLDLGNLDLNSLDPSDLQNLTNGDLDLSTVDLNSLNVNSILAENPDLIGQLLGSAGSSGSRFNIDENTRLSVRFARRLYEYGRENTQDIQQRERRRQAYVDFEKKLREVLATSRKKFFIGLLKEKQISVRSRLLEEFKAKYDRLKTRFEQAQDILKIDVLTSELDVLNERLVINGLEKEKSNAGIELSKLMGSVYNKDLVFAGNIDPFHFSEEDVVRLTQENSYASELLRQQIADQSKILKEIVWTWRPNLSLKGGIQYRTFSVGMGVQQSNGTFGLDVGAESYLNLPDTNIDKFDGNKQKYAFTLGMNVPFYSGKDREATLERERAVLKQLQARHGTQLKLEEQQARSAYQTLKEARERERLQAERVNISRRRLQITQVLRDSGKVSEVSLETFRDRFFSDQDALFREQNNVIEVQETLRQLMGVFE